MKLTTTCTILVACGVFGGIEAFAPVGPGASTFTRHSKMTASGMVGSGIPHSSTTLAMKGNLVDRFIRVFNANVNKFVSGLEDPEKVIVQAVDDMQVCEEMPTFNTDISL